MWLTHKYKKQNWNFKYIFRQNHYDIVLSNIVRHIHLKNEKTTLRGEMIRTS